MARFTRMGLAFSFLIWAFTVCSSTSDLEYTYSSPSSGNLFNGNTILGRETHANGIRTQIHLLPLSFLREISRRLRPTGTATRYTLDLLPIRLSVFNTNLDAIEVDTECFRIEDMKAKRISQPIGLETFDKQYYQATKSFMDYRMAFGQKSSFLFLHEIPDYYVDWKIRDSSSVAEWNRRKEIDQKRVVQFQKKRIMRGEEMKAVILFSQLYSPGKYRLSYSCSGFSFEPIEFRSEVGPPSEVGHSQKEDHPSNEASPSEVNPHTKEKETPWLEGQKWERTELRENLDFQAQHLQLRKHDELREGDAKMKAE